MTDYEDKQKRFERVNEFIKSVTGSNSNQPYEITVDADVVTLLLNGSINDVQWSGIEHMTNELENFRDKSYLIDLSNITYIGSSTIAILIRIWKHALSFDQKFVIVSDTKAVTDVFEISGLDRQIKIYKTKEDALKAISAK